jgi:hypothetical protein
MDNELAIRQATAVGPMSAAGLREQVNLIQQVMKEVMQGPSKDEPNGVHYGLIPGCGNKPSLFKAGAEKLSLVFRLRPIMCDEKDIKVIDMENGHREYRVLCHILNSSGQELATGVGSSCTKESKHRYRDDKRKCPECGAETIVKGKEEYGGGWLCFAKKGGCGAKFKDNDPAIIDQKIGKIENPDIADVYNTVLKMGKKRAYVDGILSATAASDIFTQDIEDMPAPALGNSGAAAHTPADAAPAKPAGVQRASASEPTKDELTALEEQRKAKAAQYAKDNPPATDTKEKPAGKEHTPADGIKTATSFVTKINEPNKGGYVTVELDNFMQDDGRFAMRFATKDTGFIETITAKQSAGEKVSIEYKSVPWSKGGKSGMNYKITDIVSVQEAQTGD